MLELDGSEGGGQLVRSALTLSTLTGRPFRMTEVRGSRPSPGLRPQHLACVELLAELADADASGDEVESETLEFDPGEVTPGEYDVDIGTAGSVPLLFDAVLPLAVTLEGRVSVRARGGTDVKWSPPIDYLKRVKLPLLRRHGLAAAVDVDRRGFYPAGGGVATLHLAPSTLEPFDLMENDATTARVASTASADLADADVAERQATAVADRLDGAGVSLVDRTVRYAETRSPGSAVVAWVTDGRAVAGFDALGERGIPAEDVGEAAADALVGFRETPGAVDGHLADQLVLPLALAGGRVRIPSPTDHVATNCDLLEAFGLEVTVREGRRGTVLEAEASPGS